jgi:predicted HD phosphohydrolase
MELNERDAAMTDTVSFTDMESGTREEYLLLKELEGPFIAGTARRVLRELEQQETETLPGYRVTRLTHSLQTATRAMREGMNDDWVVSALLHDIGDGLAPENHSEIAAGILRPFVSADCLWTIEHHGEFQMYYYGHHYGWDRNQRDQYRGHEFYDVCDHFCAAWDQTSFDPDYDTEPLATFVPAVERVFARPAWKQPGDRR